MRRTLALLLAAAGLSGCIVAQQQKPAPRPARAPPLACAPGQEHLRTAELFLGRKTPATTSPADLQRFIDQEITPRFPEGVTVLDGGAQWQGSENALIRDAAKVVLIVLPAAGDPQAKVEAVRTAFRNRFNQDSVVVVTQPACVAF
jgi:hypothetical protein